ncbi:hypothetical protein BC477_02505 [Clavibacter michiganensis subsp. michiganensis]|uniref:Uncharacterized protein n=1 Tax=Clavibacter michiganensis subsp. michiganensis TaxID=33013 RepID=A0A251XJF7_CLAMM|nr:hypothetical protein BC477_02505 [Clavibacter michiganensis subsp. michiganensis]OUE03581.1 hypothetical protein CMMCAS07_01440 [Clavibacter michiganensis subsp. michiganensis]
MARYWEHTDADFTFEELANTIAWLIESGADFDPLDTGNINPNNQDRRTS